jgi:hypothetical protein
LLRAEWAKTNKLHMELCLPWVLEGAVWAEALESPPVQASDLLTLCTFYTLDTYVLCGLEWLRPKPFYSSWFMKGANIQSSLGTNRPYSMAAREYCELL